MPTKKEQERDDRVRARDMALLKSLVECDRLSELEANAFSGMLERLGKGSSVFWTLTETQRQWAEDRYEKLELDGAEEPTPMTELQRKKAEQLGPMDLSVAGPKVLTPPVRKKPTED